MQQMFFADLIASSPCFGYHYAHHQEIKSIIQWLLSVVFRAVVLKLLVWCGTEGYVSGLQDACSILQTGHITLRFNDHNYFYWSFWLNIFLIY